ncbi:cyclohexanecarboxylate-CoA ligase [Streptomyces antnestii]|uniref:Cyclohexanecarboxylate-CoA ligase n=1 Tax=Streptomyces antnestii TaxID=2494256 RepID=A0A3S2YWB4_9ACTN|nr:AMP-binding protein [Streptomyces sp. San01]RVU20846.1 cyclohexanecarboxylate-CoA ligase [Streptomyces sp. San01]
MRPTHPPAAELAAQYRAHGDWRDRPIAGYLRRAATLWPDALALVDGDRRLTFADVDRQATALAAALHARGIGQDDVVSFQLPNRAEAVVLFQAIMKVGAVAHPIVPIYRGHELRFILRQARTKIVFVPGRYRDFDYPDLYRRLRDALPELREVVVVDGDADDGTSSWEALLGSAGPDPEAAVDALPEPDPDQVCLLLYTSGTTADPKGVLHSHNTLVFENFSMIDQFALNERDVIFNPSPVTHITGVNCALVLPFLLGAPVVLQDLWDPVLALRRITSNAASFAIFSTPFLTGLLAAAEASDVTAPTLRYLVCGGAAIPDDLPRRAADRLGVVTRMYGATEGPSVTAADRWDPAWVRSRTDGTPLAPTEVVVSDGSGGTAPVGVLGEVLWRGPDTCLGYLDERLNEAAFTPDGWFRSGDLARFDEHGALHIEGRIKDVVNRSGEKISVHEVENLLGEHPAVAEVAVVAGPDDRTGERACAFVVTGGERELTLQDIGAHLTAREVATQKIPESLFVVDALPYTASGKIKKFALREWLRDRGTASKSIAGMTVLHVHER